MNQVTLVSEQIVQITAERKKLCRLRSQRGSNKNGSVFLCVFCACLQKTLYAVLLLLTLKDLGVESAVRLARPEHKN